jgi:hypothetical protein
MGFRDRFSHFVDICRSDEGKPIQWLDVHANPLEKLDAMFVRHESRPGFSTARAPTRLPLSLSVTFASWTETGTLSTVGSLPIEVTPDGNADTVSDAGG